MDEYDLCLAWNWEYDTDFVGLLETACRQQGVSFLQITPETLDDRLGELNDGRLIFSVFLDRASDSDTRFIPLAQWVSYRSIHSINPRSLAVKAGNKAIMHLEFISSGLQTPHTIILPPYEEQPELPDLDLTPLGDRFAIKPAHGGGGVGVLIEAVSLDQVLLARQEYPADTYLLQAHVVPDIIDGRIAWFRGIYCTGTVYPFWWNSRRPVYEPVTAEDESLFGLQPLTDITRSIARICRLELFSSEISRTGGGLFTVVDFVNDPIDLRVQSRAVDGIPDHIVRDIADLLASIAAERRNK